MSMESFCMSLLYWAIKYFHSRIVKMDAEKHNRSLNILEDGFPTKSWISTDSVSVAYLLQQ